MALAPHPTLASLERKAAAMQRYVALTRAPPSLATAFVRDSLRAITDYAQNPRARRRASPEKLAAMNEVLLHLALHLPVLLGARDGAVAGGGEEAGDVL